MDNTYHVVQPVQLNQIFQTNSLVPSIFLAQIEKTLNDLVSGSLKRQKKWDDRYAAKTPKEIEELAKAGDEIAKTMKKIYEQSKRLLDKIKQKHK